VLAAFAAPAPWFTSDQFTDSDPPGATLDEPSVMFSGKRSDCATIEASPRR
jgi:hypothetical protein